MATVNYLTIQNTPWGTVVSSLVRAWAFTNKELAANISFADLDIDININGKELDQATFECFVKTLNTSANIDSAANVRDRYRRLLGDVQQAMESASPTRHAQSIIDELYNTLSSVDLTFLLESTSASCDSSEHYSDVLHEVRNARNT